MRWPVKRRTIANTGGAQARKQAERDLERTRAETEKYATLAEDLREIRQRNHLAIAFIHAAARGRRA